MTVEYLRDCVPMWDEFELRLKHKYITLLVSGSLTKINGIDRGASKIYEEVGSKYWLRGYSDGTKWLRQFNKSFFESKYHSFRNRLYTFRDLDSLLEPELKAMPERIRQSLRSPNFYLRIRAAEECFQLTLKPILARRKEEMLEELQQMEAELTRPVPYDFSLPMEENPRKFPMEFAEKLCVKGDIGEDLSGFAYSRHGRTYMDVTSLWAGETERLSEDAALGRDVYGEGVLKTYFAVPTFDSFDRLWDSRVLEYLMFDGRDINLVVMRGGIKIASLTFYDQLLSADVGLNPYFEKLGWPTAGISWRETGGE